MFVEKLESHRLHLLEWQPPIFNFAEALQAPSNSRRGNYFAELKRRLEEAARVSERKVALAHKTCGCSSSACCTAAILIRCASAPFQLQLLFESASPLCSPELELSQLGPARGGLGFGGARRACRPRSQSRPRRAAASRADGKGLACLPESSWGAVLCCAAAETELPLNFLAAARCSRVCEQSSVAIGVVSEVASGGDARLRANCQFVANKSSVLLRTNRTERNSTEQNSTAQLGTEQPARPRDGLRECARHSKASLYLV